jgi:hypothetical protein
MKRFLLAAFLSAIAAFVVLNALGYCSVTREFVSRQSLIEAAVRDEISTTQRIPLHQVDQQLTREFITTYGESCCLVRWWDNAWGPFPIKMVALLFGCTYYTVYVKSGSRVALYLVDACGRIGSRNSIDKARSGTRGRNLDHHRMIVPMPGGGYVSGRRVQ